jgi:hypothetical protein
VLTPCRGAPLTCDAINYCAAVLYMHAIAGAGAHMDPSQPKVVVNYDFRFGLFTTEPIRPKIRQWSLLSESGPIALLLIKFWPVAHGQWFGAPP